MERSTFLECGPERCIAEVLRPRLLDHVAAPLVKFAPADSQPLPDPWVNGNYWVKMFLFGMLPLGKQMIGISFPVREERRLQMRDDGHSAIIRTWDHWIIIEEADGGTRYTDRVEVKAGLLTPLIWTFAWVFYRHRQRRWRGLVAKEFFGTSPS